MFDRRQPRPSRHPQTIDKNRHRDHASPRTVPSARTGSDRAAWRDIRRGPSSQPIRPLPASRSPGTQSVFRNGPTKRQPPCRGGCLSMLLSAGGGLSPRVPRLVISDYTTVIVSACRRPRSYRRRTSLRSAFWQTMFTSRRGVRVGVSHIFSVFPNPSGMTRSEYCGRGCEGLEQMSRDARSSSSKCAVWRPLPGSALWRTPARS